MNRFQLVTAALAVCLGGGLAVTATHAAASSARPAGGRPAVAQGNSLAQAAGKPHGVGAQDNTGSGTSRRAVKPPRQKGKTDKKGDAVNSAGCLLDYGQGVVCLPAVPPDAADMGMDEVSMPWTCTGVRVLLPNGIKVNGKDVLRLDSNKDGVACGPGDLV